MPAGEQCAITRHQRADFRKRRAGGFFEHDVPAGGKRLCCNLVPPNRWCGDRNGIYAQPRRDQRIDIAEIGDAFDTRIAANGDNEFEPRIGGDRRKMLVTGDLADADERETNTSHAPPLAPRVAAA